MATKKIKIKKSTLTLRLEGKECELINDVKRLTFNKSATKSIIIACNYYINDRFDDLNTIGNYRSELSLLKEKQEEYNNFFRLMKKLSDSKIKTAR
jgi:hypothetical protein